MIQDLDCFTVLCDSTDVLKMAILSGNGRIVYGIDY